MRILKEPLIFDEVACIQRKITSGRFFGMFGRVLLWQLEHRSGCYCFQIFFQRVSPFFNQFSINLLVINCSDSLYKGYLIFPRNVYMILSRQVHSSSMTFFNAHGSGIGGVKFEFENKLYVKEWEYKFSACSSSFFEVFFWYRYPFQRKNNISEKCCSQLDYGNVRNLIARPGVFGAIVR